MLKSGILVCGAAEHQIKKIQKVRIHESFWHRNVRAWILNDREKQKKIDFARKTFFLFLVNLTEREHSQSQTWGETAVTVGIKEKTKKQKQEHFSLLSKKPSQQLTELNIFHILFQEPMTTAWVK